jgi:hypothetical protein
MKNIEKVSMTIDNFFISSDIRLCNRLNKMVIKNATPKYFSWQKAV